MMGGQTHSYFAIVVEVREDILDQDESHNMASD